MDNCHFLVHSSTTGSVDCVVQDWLASIGWWHFPVDADTTRSDRGCVHGWRICNLCGNNSRNHPCRSNSYSSRQKDAHAQRASSNISYGSSRDACREYNSHACMPISRMADGDWKILRMPVARREDTQKESQSQQETIRRSLNGEATITSHRNSSSRAAHRAFNIFSTNSE